MSSDPLRECPDCGTAVACNERYCPSCTCDLGAPNVRECSAAGECRQLQKRFDDAKSEATKNKAEREWRFFRDCVKNESGVVIAMPAQIARSLVSDPRTVYANYEALVGSTLRRPATPDNDRHRKAVAGLLFGQTDSQIRYGCLAIANEALASYGDVACGLRPETVKKRTTFLEENSYDFVRRHGLEPGKPIPAGFRAVWENRDKLALAKLGRKLKRGQRREELRGLLIQSSGDRTSDQFIEAHVYGGFTVEAVEMMTKIPKSGRTSRETRLDIKIALSQFSKRRSKS